MTGKSSENLTVSQLTKLRPQNVQTDFAYRSLLARKAEENVRTRPLGHLTQDVQQFGGMSWLKQKRYRSNKFETFS